ncbi:hypothetical protein OLOG_00187 [Ostreococcus lucimarinus virus OlV4]|nr:hypothetical protein OLOG_00187 [Ostreococcus lucimarinus virus OlV4]
MDEHQKFCIEEAKYHLNRANELLTDGLQDPKNTMMKLENFMEYWLRCFL